VTNESGDLPASMTAVRFLGGSRWRWRSLILMSILVALGAARRVDRSPGNILHSLGCVSSGSGDLGFDAVNWPWRYSCSAPLIVIR